MELAGLEENYRGEDESLTVKVYGARDADNPPYPRNNFGTVPGSEDCCAFRINPQSLQGNPPQAFARADGGFGINHKDFGSGHS